MKKLGDILNGVNVLQALHMNDPGISEIVFDSRKAAMGCMFVAVSGTRVDGHTFIAQAIKQGAAVVVCEKLPENTESDVVYIKVKDSNEALGIMASNFYNNPSAKLRLIGVTGTNGKTTIVTLLFKVFTLLGHKCGYLSTIKNSIVKEEIQATHTTPDALQINALLAEMVKKKCAYAFMEVSSHAVVQQRIKGLSFAGGVFTNITHDHLDYHKTFADYLKAKKGFFDTLNSDAIALVNADDKNSKVMLQNCPAKKLTYSLKTVSDYKIKLIESHFDGTLLQIDGTEFWTKLIGEFNAYNMLAVYAVTIESGHSKEEVLKILSELPVVEGRFQTIQSGTGIVAIIDYAHTPDAVQNVIKSINFLRTGNEKLITVIGAGGNRDKEKRPLMAKYAAEGSDKVILTSDNPRDEDPGSIIADMKKGLDEITSKKATIITDREQAIAAACFMAEAGDIVLIAGKGHETYQEIKGKRTFFSDAEVVKKQFMLNNINLQ